MLLTASLKSIYSPYQLQLYPQRNLDLKNSLLIRRKPSAAIREYQTRCLAHTIQLDQQPRRPQAQVSPLLKERRTTRKPGPLWQSQVSTQTIPSVTLMMTIFPTHQRAQSSLPSQPRQTVALPRLLLRTRTLIFPLPLLVPCGLRILKPHQVRLFTRRKIAPRGLRIPNPRQIPHQIRLFARRRIAR